MKKVLSIISPIAVVLLLFTGCNRNKSEMGQNPTITSLKHWECIGPFYFDTIKQLPEETYRNLDLQKFGIDEEHFKKDDFKSLPSYLQVVKIKDPEGTINFLDFTGTQISDMSNFYLFAEKDSKKDEDVVLVIDGSYGYKLWLNGEMIVEDLRKYNTNKLGDRFVPVTLMKGANIFFAKVNRGTNKLSWKFNLSIVDKQEAEKAFYDNCFRDFILNPQPIDTMFLHVGPFKDGFVEIMNNEKKSVFQKRFEPSDISKETLSISETSEFEPGFYDIILTHNQYVLNQKIYKGDIHLLSKIFKEEIDALQIDEIYKVDLLCAHRRFEHCINDIPDLASRSNTQYKQGNNVFYGFNIHSALNHIKMHSSLFGFSGTILKNYLSEDNNSYHSFLFYTSGTPEEIARKPVIFMVPYELEGDDFITGWYLSSLDQIHVDARLADEYGFSIAWLFLGGSTYTHKLADRDISGAIGTLINDYKIDPKNIYLNGDCTGGMRALLMAARRPFLFAGVAAHGPVTMGDGQNGPINMVQNLKNVYTCIIHGQNDKVVPISHTKMFIREARKFGFTPELVEIVDKGKHSISKAYHVDSFRKLHEFHTRREQKNVTSIKYRTYEKDIKQAYWIQFKPNPIPLMSEIAANFDSGSGVFIVSGKNVQEFSINTELLTIAPDNLVHVTHGKKTLFQGKASELAELKLSLN